MVKTFKLDDRSVAAVSTEPVVVGMSAEGKKRGIRGILTTIGSRANGVEEGVTTLPAAQADNIGEQRDADGRISSVEAEPLGAAGEQNDDDESFELEGEEEEQSAAAVANLGEEREALVMVSSAEILLTQWLECLETVWVLSEAGQPLPENLLDLMYSIRAALFGFNIYMVRHPENPETSDNVGRYNVFGLIDSEPALKFKPDVSLWFFIQSRLVKHVTKVESDRDFFYDSLRELFKIEKSGDNDTFEKYREDFRQQITDTYSSDELMTSGQFSILKSSTDSASYRFKKQDGTFAFNVPAEIFEGDHLQPGNYTVTFNDESGKLEIIENEKLNPDQGELSKKVLEFKELDKAHITVKTLRVYFLEILEASMFDKDFLKKVKSVYNPEDVSMMNGEEYSLFNWKNVLSDDGLNAIIDNVIEMFTFPGVQYDLVIGRYFLLTLFSPDYTIAIDKLSEIFENSLGITLSQLGSSLASFIYQFTNLTNLENMQNCVFCVTDRGGNELRRDINFIDERRQEFGALNINNDEDISGNPKLHYPGLLQVANKIFHYYESYEGMNVVQIQALSDIEFFKLIRESFYDEPKEYFKDLPDNNKKVVVQNVILTLKISAFNLVMNMGFDLIDGINASDLAAAYTTSLQNKIDRFFAQQLVKAKQLADAAREELAQRQAGELARQAEEETRQAEESARRAEEARQAEEATRRAKEARQLEEARQVEEMERAEEARQVEEAARRAEEVRQEYLRSVKKEQVGVSRIQEFVSTDSLAQRVVDSQYGQQKLGSAPPSYVDTAQKLYRTIAREEEDADYSEQTLQEQGPTDSELVAAVLEAERVQREKSAAAPTVILPEATGPYNQQYTLAEQERQREDALLSDAPDEVDDGSTGTKRRNNNLFNGIAKSATRTMKKVMPGGSSRQKTRQQPTTPPATPPPPPPMPAATPPLTPEPVPLDGRLPSPLPIGGTPPPGYSANSTPARNNTGKKWFGAKTSSSSKSSNGSAGNGAAPVPPTPLPQPQQLPSAKLSVLDHFKHTEGKVVPSSDAKTTLESKKKASELVRIVATPGASPAISKSTYDMVTTAVVSLLHTSPLSNYVYSVERFTPVAGSVAKSVTLLSKNTIKPDTASSSPHGKAFCIVKYLIKIGVITGNIHDIAKKAEPALIEMITSTQSQGTTDRNMVTIEMLKILLNNATNAQKFDLYYSLAATMVLDETKLNKITLGSGTTKVRDLVLSFNAGVFSVVYVVYKAAFYKDPDFKKIIDVTASNEALVITTLFRIKRIAAFDLIYAAFEDYNMYYDTRFEKIRQKQMTY